MTHPEQDLLIDVALGSPVPPTAAEHLATCERCTAEIADLRQTADTVRASRREQLHRPPATVWSAVLADLNETPPSTSGLGRDDQPPGDELTGRAMSSKSRRWGRGALAAACAAGIAAGSLLTYALIRPDPDPSTTRLAAAELLSPNGRGRVGEAHLISSPTNVDLRVRTDALEPGSGYLEIWLINKDLRRMVSIGVLPSGEATTVLPVTRRLIDEGYLVVDISREAFDDQPQHSGVTLARGTLVP